MEKIQKIICFNKKEWEKIQDYRFENRIEKQSEAIKNLIKLGLEYHKKKLNEINKEIDENM